MQVMTLLSFSILVPLFLGLFLLAKDVRGNTGKSLALFSSVFVLLCACAIAARARETAEFATSESFRWLPAIGLQFFLAADGISSVFLLLTGVVFVMGIFASSPTLDGRYFGFVLLLESGLIGTFTAQNFLHFFVFWEIALLPAFFLVRIYGGAMRSAASIQFFIYTMFGSIAMLVGFLALYLATGTFNFAEIAAARPAGGFGALLSLRLNGTGLGAQSAGMIIFLLAFLGVAVKVPLFPLHSWLPVTYTQAPTPVTMLLTGVMSKMGVYALIRLILPIFPDEIQRLHQPLLALAVITILYGALAAFAQRDIKQMFAYSSLSHLGYCFLGIFAAAKAGAAGLENERAAAINGVLLQVFSHGIIAAALFACVAFLERRGDGLRSYESFGGLRKINPVFAGLMGIALFSSLGLPGLSGFPAEFLIFKGAFSLAPVACGFAVLGLLFTALYLLTFYGRVFFGPLNAKRAAVTDLTSAEIAVLVPAIAITVLVGIAPQLVLAICNPAVTALVQRLKF
ncbi:MAG TPA: NADH-quinone oxidoreductase subunit M [Verrucomicrobiae bacterium]